MRTCYIHLGTHKTGTTSIQMMLRESEEALLRFGFDYPVIGRGPNSNAHHELAFAIRDEGESQDSADVIDAFLKHVGSFSRDVIISSEEFVNALYFSPDRFRRFVCGLRKYVDRVVAILYLRSQESYIVSNYLERLKYSFTPTFEEYALAHISRETDEIPLDYLEVLTLAQEISDGHLVARSYDGVRKGGLLAEFQDLLGVKDLLPNHEVRVNIRQPLPELIRLYYENRTGQVASTFERQIIMEMISIMTDDSITLSSSLSSLIRSRFDLSNRYIREHYGVSLNVDDGTMPENTGTPIDRIFTERLARLIQTLSRFPERLDFTDAALAEAQRLAVNRFQQIKDFEGQLNRVHVALGETQRLAVDRSRQITDLEGQRDRMHAALEEGQRLAGERTRQITDLEGRLTQVRSALEKAQHLAIKRYETIALLERQLQNSGIDKVERQGGLSPGGE